MAYTGIIHPRDRSFLAERKIPFDKVEKSFFQTPPDWKCPLCGREKHVLLHKRRDGVYYSGIMEHEWGNGCGNWLESGREKICYLCKSSEKRYRLENGIKDPLPIDKAREALGYARESNK